MEPTGTRTWARVTWESLSTLQALGPGPELPGTAGGPGGPSDTGTRYQGQLVKTADTRTRARVTRESWWTT